MGDCMRIRIKLGELAILELCIQAESGHAVLVTTREWRSMLRPLGNRRGSLVEPRSTDDNRWTIKLAQADVVSIYAVGAS